LINKTLKDNIIENTHLINYLRKKKNEGIKLGLISNQWSLSLKVYLPKRYYTLFDGMVISCEDKIRKPDPYPLNIY